HSNDFPPDPDQAPMPFTHRVPPIGRRGLAWGLELAILLVGVAVPVYGGIYHTQRAEQTDTFTEVSLSPLLQTAQTTVARSLGLPQRSLRETVTPLTHGLWSAALGIPVVLLGIHIYSLGRWGASGPKAWLRIQVITLDGQRPTWRQSLVREGVGKWGIPLAIAYGLWRVAGGFPNPLILIGLSALTLTAESATALLNRARRPWHDWLAVTCTVDPDTGAIVRLTHQWESESTETDDQAALPPATQGGAITWTEDESGLTAVVLNPGPTWPEQKPPRRFLPPALSALLLLGLVGLSAAGGYFWRGRTLTPVSDPTLFGQLVATLTNPEADLDTKQAAILALGNTPDAQVTSLLVDLMGQADDPEWLDTLHQAILERGSAAVPHLRRLNQSLSRDLSEASNAPQKQRLTLRLQTVNRSLAKLISLEGDRVHTLDLRGLHLGYLSQGGQDFTLNLNKQNLAGIQWQGTRLNRAQLSGATFFDPGPDQTDNTYDDRTADLRGADLTDTDLAGVNLTLAQLQGSGLLRANLTGANLTGTDLQRVNLERAILIQANLTEANLTQARLTAADLTEAVLIEANLTNSNLRLLDATGVVFTGANLRGAELQEAALADADLSGAVLTDANLQGADLQGADLQGADLQGANLRYTTLQGVRWQGANLAGVDLEGATLSTAEVETSDGFVTAAPDLDSGQQLLGVDFSEALNLSPGQVNYICAQGGIHSACPAP
ncbi:MAG: pentapeptide repeat-containing protein, partial [Leptolyngbyaceae cyanobacterium]